MPEILPRRSLYFCTDILSAEDVEKYRPGGYHPVDIGDINSSGERNYEVIHKLGHGGFSTVWLVRLGTPSLSLFSLKILRADVTKSAGAEIKILEHLRTATGSRHPNVVYLHDSFQITGPNGDHGCLVFPFLGPSYYNIDGWPRKNVLPSTTRYELCRQVASATAFLHQHGVCHAGKPVPQKMSRQVSVGRLTKFIADLTRSNIVFELPDSQSMSPAGILQLLGPIEAEYIRPRKERYAPHAPKQLVDNAEFPDVDFSMLTRVRIIDFGSAYFADQPPKSLGVPIDYFPPELCFGYLPSTKSDVWQLACLFYQIHTGRYFIPTGFEIYEALIGTAVHRLGPLPQSWQGKFDHETYGYMENGEAKFEEKSVWYWYEDKKIKETIEDRLAVEAPDLSAHRRKDLADLLIEMAVYEPGKRLSAAEVTQRLEKGSLSGVLYL